METKVIVLLIMCVPMFCTRTLEFNLLGYVLHFKFAYGVGGRYWRLMAVSIFEIIAGKYWSFNIIVGIYHMLEIEAFFNWIIVELLHISCLCGKQPIWECFQVLTVSVNGIQN